MSAIRPLYIAPPPQEQPEAGRLILRDGSTATLSPAGEEDREALHDFFLRLSPESRYRRFFSQGVPDAVRDLCASNDPNTMLTLLVTRTVAGNPTIIATATYRIIKETRAEIAFAVDDAFQGKGIASQLLERLAMVAAHHGITTFEAITMTENRPMIEVFRNSGFRVETEQAGSVVVVDISVIPTARSVQETVRREQEATIASLDPFFKPRAVAVIGASHDPKSVGYRVVESLVQGHFRGAVYPVNPKGGDVYSMRVYPSVRDLPEVPDLAVITAPRDAVSVVVDECATMGVRALVVITAGFAEITGRGGRTLQKQLLEKVRGYGMRMVGPNCLGLVNSDPTVNLNASFSPIAPIPGRVAMASQSGALGLAILALTREMNLGLSAFVSLGNKADVSGNDLLQYWGADERTNTILLYLESFGNPRRFAHLARQVSRKKPIVVVKSGRTRTGQRAASSHTAALASSDTAVDALVHQSGVIRAESLDEMFELAMALSHQPLPRGNRVGIITNAGGPGILCADACEAGGLKVPELATATRDRIAEFLPVAASAANPIDLIASATAEQYQRTIEILLAGSEIDALVVIHIPVGMSSANEVKQAIVNGVVNGRAGGGTDKPVLVCWMAGETVTTPAPLATGSESIPITAYPETPGRVLGKMSAYAGWRAKPEGIVPDWDDIEPQRARLICHNALAGRGEGWLTATETRRVLEAFRLPVAPGGVAQTAEDAVKLAEQIGYPVAAKLASHRLVHKTEIGGVLLNLANVAAVADAFNTIHAAVETQNALDSMEGVLIQPMLKGGVEVMMGMSEEPRFGPLLAFGLGGIHVEVLGDVAFRMTPLTDRDADEMVKSIRGYRLLKGYRNLPPGDIPAVIELLLRLSRLVEDVSEIRELDLNPVFVFPESQGCMIVDARIRVGETAI